MKITLLRKLLLGLLTVMFTAAGALSPAVAQTIGNIRGKVLDQQGSALPGASVRVKGTTKGVSTTLTGDYLLNDLTPGSYVVAVVYMGYEPYETTLQVAAGQTVVHNIKLATSSVALKGITVTSIIEGQQRALNQQRNADNMKQVISADLMGRFPDLNVAESLQRLPGVTIGRELGEGSTIQLRGTPGGFTNINFNGEQIMGTQEGGQRNAQLDLVPANVLSSMEVVKTLTPDLDGDAIAGAINLRTPTATSLSPKVSLDLGGGYNKLRNKANAIGNFSYAQRFFKTDDNPNGKLGIATSLSHYNTVNGYDEINAQVWQTKSFATGEAPIYFPTDIRLVYLENNRTRQGGTATVDYVVNPKTSFVANFTYTDLDNDATRYRKRTRMQTANTTRAADGSYVTTRGRGYNEVLDRQTSNSNWNLSLEGETTTGKLKIDGGLFFTRSLYDQEAYAYNYITGNVPLTISAITGDYIQANGSTDTKNNPALYTYNTVEANNYNTQGRNLSARLNFTYPYKIGDADAYVKAGVKIKRMNNRRFRPEESTFVATYSGAAAAGNLNNFAGSTELSSGFLDGAVPFGLSVSKDATLGFYANNPGSFTKSQALTQVSIDTYFYDADENVIAGYLMNRIQFKKLMLLGGLRVERTAVDYDARLVNQDVNGNLVSSTPTNQKNTYTKFLPNIQAKYDLFKNTVLRSGLTFGYSRPGFVDLVPSRVISILSATVTDGNPDLQPAFSTNFDLSVEQYLKTLGIVSAGYFKKRISKFQYNSVVTLTGNEFAGASAYTNYQYYKTYNGDVANVEGLEFNFQTNFTYLPGLLKGLTLYANYTYVTSKANAQLRQGLRLPGQAKNSFNTSLAYSYKFLTLQGNVNYNGSYTSTLGTDNATDVIRNDRYQFDVNASARLTKKLTLYAEGVNLSNAPQIEYFGDRSRIYSKQYYGYSGRAGLKYRF